MDPKNLKIGQLYQLNMIKLFNETLKQFNRGNFAFSQIAKDIWTYMDSFHEKAVLYVEKRAITGEDIERFSKASSTWDKPAGKWVYEFLLDNKKLGLIEAQVDIMVFEYNEG